MKTYYGICVGTVGKVLLVYCKCYERALSTLKLMMANWYETYLQNAVESADQIINHKYNKFDSCLPLLSHCDISAPILNRPMLYMLGQHNYGCKCQQLQIVGLQCCGEKKPTKDLSSQRTINSRPFTLLPFLLRREMHK